MTSATHVTASKLMRPSPLACQECRKKHLKCDAITPICSRCSIRGYNCSYTPSRRGIGGRKKRQTISTSRTAPNASPAGPAYPSHAGGRPEYFQVGTTTDPMRVGSPARTWTDLSDTSQHTSTPNASATSPSSLRSEDELLTNLYYSSFHACHPILVPRTRYANQQYPEHLHAAVKFIGSHYAQMASGETLRSPLTALLAEHDERTPETVQALLLYAIALHARYEPMEAMPAITKAANLAIELGMHRSDYAATHGEDDPVFEESLRRTWWELYVTDGYINSLHRNINFRCNTVLSSTLLPCEDSAYAQGLVPCPPMSLSQFDARLFSDEECSYSSFCYRIEAIRILARVMAVSSTNEVHPDGVQAIDNAIASFKHHLPNDKAGIIDPSGEGDQLMFQAFVFIQCASIFLHFPRSELPITMPPSADIACARQHMEQVSATSTQHAAKAISASKDLANLAALPMEKHSPFFICGLVFACVVNLSACSAYPGRSSTHRDRVALILGVLKSLSRTWVIAHYVSQQLKRAASEIFKIRPELSAAPSNSSYDSGIDMSGFPSDLSSWLDLFNSPYDGTGFSMQHQALGSVHDATGI